MKPSDGIGKSLEQYSARVLGKNLPETKDEIGLAEIYVAAKTKRTPLDVRRAILQILGKTEKGGPTA